MHSSFSKASATAHLPALAQALLMAFGLACVVALPMVINPFGAQPYAFGKFQWLLLCAASMLGAALLLLSEASSASRGRVASPGRDPVVVLFAGWVVWLVITSVFAVDPVPAWLGDSLRREGALSWLALGATAVVVCTTARDQARRSMWILAICLGSLVPAGATLQQFVHSDWTFSQTLIGTLGNPVFLGALMMLALPLAVAQWLAAVTTGQRVVWGLVAGIQGAALLLSMARGPLIGAVIALWALQFWVGLVQRRRGVRWLALAVPALAGFALLLINLIPAMAEQVPALGRFQFKASGSSDARLGIWSAGLTLFTESGLMRQLVGYGTDTGILVFMSYMPASVFRIEGLGVNVDRMHSQILESLLTTGTIGMLIELGLFGALMHRWLQVCGVRIALWRAYTVAFVIGVLFAATGLLLLPSPVWPSLFGIGYGIGWLGIWLTGAWRGSNRQPTDAIGLTVPVQYAALGVGLAAYWMESQLGVNDVAVRVFAFAIAGLVAAHPVSEARVTADDSSKAPADGDARLRVSLLWVVWATVPFLFLVLAPPSQSNTAWLAPSLGSMAWALAIGGVFIAFAGFCNRLVSVHASSGGDLAKTGAAIILWNGVGLLLFGACYFVGMSSLAGGTVEAVGLDVDLTIATWCVFGTALLVTLGAAIVAFGAAPHAPFARFALYPGRAWSAVVCAIPVLLGAGMFAVMESRSGIASKLHFWANGQGKTESAARYAREAVLLSPTQRTTWVGLSQIEFSLALSAARSAGPDDPARAALVKDRLARSIGAAQRGLSVADGDPFLLALLAETSSLKAAPFAADVFGGEAARKGHGQEAIRYFEQSLKRRGNHPYSLRSLVRLELDYGTRERALQFAERLIASDPKSEIGHEEKALIALKANDMAQFAAVLRDGIEKTGGAPSLRRPLAEWLFRQGDVAGAVRELEAVVAKTPKDWAAVRDLIRLYLRQNANDKALTLAQGARAFVPEQERASLEELLRNLEPKPFTGGGLKP